jgi:hypothetical protein
MSFRPLKNVFKLVANGARFVRALFTTFAHAPTILELFLKRAFLRAG